MTSNLIRLRDEELLATASPATQMPSEEQLKLENAVKTSLLNLLSNLTASDDEAMITIGASANEFIEPLGKHEVQVLACALYMEKQGQPLAYQDVLRLTDRFSGRAMNVTMIYKTIERLIERSLLKQAENVDGNGNRSRTYLIEEQGRDAFKLAVLNSRLLAGAKSSAAA